MELINDDKQTATLKFTNAEYAVFSRILDVFESKMENNQVDYERMMHTKEEVRAFVDRFFEIFEK